MNLPSLVAVVTFALQGKTPLSSSGLLLVQSLFESRCACSLMCTTQDASSKE